MSRVETLPRVRAVEPLDGFVLRLAFTDGTTRVVDLGPELWGPVFEPLREDPDLFRQVRVDEELGTIVWPNGADMDPDVLRGDRAPAEGLSHASSHSDAGEARRAHDRRARAARRFKPSSVDLLLVAESPPRDPRRYFYFDDVEEHDGLFRYVAWGILGQRPRRKDKRSDLEQLQRQGVFLIDLKPDPTDPRHPGEFVPELVEAIRRLQPRKVILIKTSVYDLAYPKLAAAGLPVVDERIPFPSSGQQRRFMDSFARALKR